MANHKSAKKRARQTLRRTLRNKQTKSKVKTFEKKVLAALMKKDKEEAQKRLVQFSSMIGKAAQKGIIHVKRASRRISRLSRQIHNLPN